LFVSFLFLFPLVTFCECCQCTHQGGDWGPCVARGPVDGRFLVWWVIDNVVWTDSWLSIASAGCVTEPLKLLPYYRLNRSSGSLSNNTEVTRRLCRVKPGESLTSQDRHL
jgi:hypothetical protein